MRSGCKIFLSVWDCDYLGHIKDGSLNYVTYAYLAFITSYIEDASQVTSLRLCLLNKKSWTASLNNHM